MMRNSAKLVNKRSQKINIEKPPDQVGQKEYHVIWIEVVAYQAKGAESLKLSAISMASFCWNI